MQMDSNESASHSEQRWTKANFKCKVSSISFLLSFLVARTWALQAGQRFLAPLTVTQAVLAGLVCPRWPPSSPTVSPSRAAAGPVRQGALAGGPANRVSISLETFSWKMTLSNKPFMYLSYLWDHTHTNPTLVWRLSLRIPSHLNSDGWLTSCMCVV